MRDYLDIEDVLYLYDQLIERYGGMKGIRDFGALEAAVYRPQTGYYDDIIQEAAALMESLVINHPFVDGNKRTGFAATDIFLEINGYKLTQSSAQIYKQMNDLFRKNKFEFESIEKWLRKYVEKIN